MLGHRSKKTSMLRITGLCAGNSPGTGEFPAQMASNAENVSIWWRHHEWAECSLIIGTGYRVQVFAWSLIAQSVCQQAFSLLAILCLRPWVRILHAAEEDNLSPFHSNITCLCQTIQINPLRAKFFRWSINIYLHFVSFLHIGTTQVVEIFPQIRQEPTYSA